MECPNCKKNIPDNTLKCPYCHVRTGLVCKNCNTINSIYDYKCKNCGKEIYKVCTYCNSANLPEARKCRKCGHPFDTGIDITKITASTEIESVTLKDGIKLLSENLLNENIKIISISGNKGIGKSTVLQETTKKLVKTNIIWMFGKCTSLTQLTPGGLIRDLILNLYNIYDFGRNNNEFLNKLIDFFKNEYPQMTTYEINNFVNFLYATTESNIDNLIQNKQNTFNLLNKVFEKLSSLGKLVIIADNFDYIDGFSYEYLNTLLKNETVINNLKIILIYNEIKSAKNYLYINNDESYFDITIKPLAKKDMEKICNSHKDILDYLTHSEQTEILEKSSGNPAFLEQALNLCFDCQVSDKVFKLPNTFEKLINKRLNILKGNNPNAYKTLVGCAILGYKIDLDLVKNIFVFNTPQEFPLVIEYLVKSKFIIPKNNNFYEFKNILLWESILTNAKKDSYYPQINIKISTVLKDLIINPNAILGIISQNLKQNTASLELWTKNANLAASIGDLNLYVICKKQCLAFINELEENDTFQQKYDIYEELGKLLSEYNPKEAIEFLPEAISNAKTINDTTKEIELMAYLANSCLKTYNYYGNIECVNSVLKKIPSQDKLKIALLKTNKLEAMLNIGDYGDIVNTIDNDIMPVLDEYLSKRHKIKFSKQFLEDTWAKTYLILAKALILQGNDRCFEILTILFDIIERNKIKDEIFICQCKLALALANTIKGDFETSQNVLSETLNLYKITMDKNSILQWNLIKIINNFFQKRYDGLREDLFEVVTFANNCGNNFYKNLVKVLLGKIFKDNHQTKQAMDIYNEQITYFAKEKITIGALLTWYLIAEATLDSEGPHAAIEIAEQALEVAQNPKIYNYIFIILLKMIMAKAYMIISDYESCKINIEHALTLALKFDLKDILSRIYLLYGKYYQEIGLIKTPMQKSYLQNAKKMYEQANKENEYTKNNFIHVKILEAQKMFSSYCNINKITF